MCREGERWNLMEEAKRKRTTRWSGVGMLLNKSSDSDIVHCSGRFFVNQSTRHPEYCAYSLNTSYTWKWTKYSCRDMLFIYQGSRGFRICFSDVVRTVVPELKSEWGMRCSNYSFAISGIWWLVQYMWTIKLVYQLPPVMYVHSSRQLAQFKIFSYLVWTISFDCSR